MCTTTWRLDENLELSSQSIFCTLFFLVLLIHLFELLLNSCFIRCRGRIISALVLLSRNIAFMTPLRAINSLLLLQFDAVVSLVNLSRSKPYDLSATALKRAWLLTRGRFRAF